MSGPNTQRKERETRIRDMNEEAKSKMAEIFFDVREIPAEAIDEELLRAFDEAVEGAKRRVERAKSNGKGEK